MTYTPVAEVKNPVKVSVPIGVVILVTALFALIGYVIGTRSDEIVATLQHKTSAPTTLDYSSLESVYKELRNSYDGKIDTAALLDGAKHGMIDAAGDPYTVYLNAEEAKAFDSDLNGTFEGIGAELAKVDGKLTVMNVLADSPAKASGLLNKDIILKINDEDASPLTLGNAVKKIRGDKGTTVKLMILRGDTTNEMTITRDKITAPSVTSEILNGNIGYLRISRFAEDTSSLASRAAENFKSKNVTKVILDLRGNGGGLVTAAQDVASLWLINKTVVSERTQTGQQLNTLKSGTDAPLSGTQTIVLVDGGSASASEIVAGALKDNGAASLLGEKTFGKGSVQEVKSLGDGGELKVTIARWYTPSGKNIHGQGIAPDTEVKLSDEDIKAGRDPQKDAAITALQ